MIKVYWTKLNVVSLKHVFSISFDESTAEPLQMEFDISCKLEARSLVHDLLYNELKKQVKKDFMLVPSQIQTLMDARAEDELYHPEKYPNNGESIGGFGGHYDE